VVPGGWQRIATVLRGDLERWQEWFDGREVVIASPLTVREATRRLNHAADPWADGVHRVPGAPGHAIRGYACAGQVRLVAFGARGSTAWTNGRDLALRARIVPAEQGCRLVGTLGGRRSDRINVYLGVGAGGLVALSVSLAGVAQADAAASRGEIAHVFAGLGTALAPWGVALLLVLMTICSGRAASRRGRFLEQWIREQINPSGPGQ
jgi:hypothetical protein